ncbi:unnamed protein product, partial [Cyprideis torosa]
MAAATPPAPGVRPLCPRLLRHFTPLALNPFPEDAMRGMFARILLWHLDTKGFSKDFDPCIDQIVNATMELYNLVRTNLKPIPRKFHLHFCIRDITRIMQ